MKKFLVSFVVIVTFLAYSMYQRILGPQATPAILPKNISSVPLQSPQVLPTDTPAASPALTPVPSPSDTTPLPTATPVPQETATPIKTSSNGYKDGTYTGNPEDAFYGTIQVQTTIAGGRIINVQFLQYPNDRSTSIYINQQADPMLAQEAIQSQSANVDIITGATDSSQAFVQSLQTALDKAKA